MQGYSYFPNKLGNSNSELNQFNVNKDLKPFSKDKGNFYKLSDTKNENSSLNKQNINYEIDNKVDKYKKKKLKYICPFCFSIISRNVIKKEPISLYEKCQCSSCKKDIVFIECLLCCREIYLQDSVKSHEYLIGMNITCPYLECNKTFSYTICGGCKRFIGIKENYIEGNSIECPYEDCKIKSSTILCPFTQCQSPNFFAENKYFEGVSMKCVNQNCKRDFAKYNCNSCFKRFYIEKNVAKSFKEGNNIKCPFSDCQKIFNKFFCTECKRLNIIENSFCDQIRKKNFNYFKCAFNDCAKGFIKINCPKCLIDNNFPGNNNLEGKRIECAECYFKFYFYYCIECENLNIWNCNNKETIYIKINIIKNLSDCNLYLL